MNSRFEDTYYRHIQSIHGLCFDSHMQSGERLHISKVFKVNLFTLCLHWTHIACASPVNFDRACAGAFAAMAEDRRLAGTVWPRMAGCRKAFVLLRFACGSCPGHLFGFSLWASFVTCFVEWQKRTQSDHFLLLVNMLFLNILNQSFLHRLSDLWRDDQGADTYEATAHTPSATAAEYILGLSLGFVDNTIAMSESKDHNPRKFRSEISELRRFKHAKNSVK